MEEGEEKFTISRIVDQFHTLITRSAKNIFAVITRTLRLLQS